MTNIVHCAPDAVRIGMPVRVVFDMQFIPSDGEWKLISINVKTERAPSK